MSNLSPIESLNGSLQYGAARADNYNNLSNKPKINDVELSGNTSFEDLGLDDVYAHKSTTLSAYGITDAYTKTEVDAKESTLNAKIADVATDVGELSNLTPTVKTNIVAAINGLDGIIDSLIDSVSKSEETMKATRDYAIGDYINVNGKLYKATKAISSGAMLSTSTNVEKVTIGDELKSVAQTATQVSVTQTSTGATITITDSTGATTTAVITNGSDASVTSANIISALGYTPVGSTSIQNIVVLTQSEYNALANKSPNTIYNIVGA